MTEEEFDKKWDGVYKEKVAKGHDVPSPETRERLSILETTQKFMAQEISEIKKLVIGLDEKFDKMIVTKADKKEVDELKETVDDLKTWKIKMMVIGSIVLFLVTFFKDPILELIKSI